MTEQKLPWTQQYNIPVDVYDLFDADGEKVGCMYRDGQAKLIVDSVNNTQRYKEALEALIEKSTAVLSAQDILSNDRFDKLYEQITISEDALKNNPEEKDKC